MVSNYVASESNDSHNTPKTSRIRGGEDEGGESSDNIVERTAADNSSPPPPPTPAPAVVVAFMHTPEFRMHLVDFVSVDALIALRLATKAWKAVVEEVITEGVASGALMVHDGKDGAWFNSKTEREGVLSYLDVGPYDDDETSEVIAHLRSQQN
ncbi:hypothetical protein TrLO_g9428 [Triparma laevis f. longispina]|uniref:Uncharacterized protein n=1 Tax=Triparma laevis f. longispina TaxID=1714387 RepID=A0A9W6ZHL3_9STRA|nr:hypothetical protein TrLO_g9428 [Triparma laevis f. longispina]